MFSLPCAHFTIFFLAFKISSRFSLLRWRHGVLGIVGRLYSAAHVHSMLVCSFQTINGAYFVRSFVRLILFITRMKTLTIMNTENTFLLALFLW
jgi:hypothetical protein